MIHTAVTSAIDVVAAAAAAAAVVGMERTMTDLV